MARRAMRLSLPLLVLLLLLLQAQPSHARRIHRCDAADGAEIAVQTACARPGGGAAAVLLLLLCAQEVRVARAGDWRHGGTTGCPWQRRR